MPFPVDGDDDNLAQRSVTPPPRPGTKALYREYSALLVIIMQLYMGSCAVDHETIDQVGVHEQVTEVVRQPHQEPTR
jgi:hypothetical protein